MASVSLVPLLGADVNNTAKSNFQMVGVPISEITSYPAEQSKNFNSKGQRTKKQVYDKVT